MVMSTEDDGGAGGLPLPEDVQATFCATLVDEWVRGGMVHAVVCPGSRSTPLALALVRNSSVTVHVRLDERSAGFFALGLSAASSLPVIVCVTSGTAAAELHAAVIEAHYQGVSLLVCTADRPAELRLVGAPQTVDQVGIYTSSTRFAVDVPAPDWTLRHTWRSLAARSLNESLCSPYGAGPVHLNLQFREPLIGRVLELPGGRPAGRTWHSTAGTRSAQDAGRLHGVLPGGGDRTALSTTITGIVDSALPGGGDQVAGSLESLVRGGLVQAKGVIVAGQLSPQDREQSKRIVSLARALEWPLLADPLSMCRVDQPGVIAGADSIVGDGYAREALRPDIVLRFGRPWASKRVNTWLAALGRDGVEQVVVDPYWGWVDPDRTASVMVNQGVDAVCNYLAGEAGQHATGRDWLGAWQAAEDAVQARIDRWCTEHGEITGPGVARMLVSYAGNGGILVVSSSLPVRDVERYGARVSDPPVAIANRGANGIDGVVSTAMGSAAESAMDVTPRNVVALVGDLAFLHDLTALVRPADAGRSGRLTVVVLDNGGGGIFSLLPQAALLDRNTMERLFTTRQKPGIEEVARGMGVPAVKVETMDALAGALAEMDAGGEHTAGAGKKKKGRPASTGGVRDSGAGTYEVRDSRVSGVRIIHAKAPGVTTSAEIYASIQKELEDAACHGIDAYLRDRPLTSWDG